MPDTKATTTSIVDNSWKKFEADFNAMTDAEIETSRREAQDQIDEQEEWVEAVAAWQAAGKPRKSNA